MQRVISYRGLIKYTKTFYLNLIWNPEGIFKYSKRPIKYYYKQINTEINEADLISWKKVSSAGQSTPPRTSKQVQTVYKRCSQLYNRTCDLGEDFPDLFMVSFTSFKSYLSLDVLFKLKRKWSRSWFVAWLLFDWQVANVWACCEFLSQTHRTLSTSDSYKL